MTTQLPHTPGVKRAALRLSELADQEGYLDLTLAEDIIADETGADELVAVVQRLIAWHENSDAADDVWSDARAALAKAGVKS